LQPTALAEVPKTIGKLHALPPFPQVVNDAVEGFIQKMRASTISPESETADAFDLYSSVREVYPRNARDMVSSHNDLKPENVLSDGERVLLVGWEAGFLNDRYLDLAVVANFVATSVADENLFLCGYFGTELSGYQLARFYLLRQILHSRMRRYFWRSQQAVSLWIRRQGCATIGIFTIAFGRGRAVWQAARRRSNTHACI
jgi:thiamine kinase-like enzyme